MGKDSVGVKGARPTTDGWSSLEDFNKLYPFSSEQYKIRCYVREKEAELL